MSEKKTIQITVIEDLELVSQIDSIAAREGLSRADVLRRAIRSWLFSLPSTYDDVSVSQKEDSQQAAA